MKLTSKQRHAVLDALVVISMIGLAVGLCSLMAWQYMQPPPLTYEGSQACRRVAFALEMTIYQVQTRQIQNSTEELKGYMKGVEDVQRGRHGLSSDAEGLCYTMLTQEQARRFLDLLRAIRQERP